MRYFLTSVDWEASGEDVRYFDSETARNEYFNLPTSLGDETFNFNPNDYINAEITINDYNINSNYIVVEFQDRYWFYYVTQATYNTAFQHTLSLYLDVFTTLWSKVDTSQQAFIMRGNVNRSISYSRPFYETPFIKAKATQLPKFTESCDLIKFKFTQNDDWNEWCEENIAGWKYYFINLREDPDYSSLTAFEFDDIVQPYAVFCCPTYVPFSTGRLYYGSYEINQSNLESFLDSQNLDAYVMSIKMGIQPPFLNFYPYDYSITSGNLVLGGSGSYGMYGLRFYSSGGNAISVLYTSSNPGYADLDLIQYRPQSGYTSEYSTNPLIMSQEWTQLYIADMFGNQYEIPLTYSKLDNLILRYNEPITPEITKSILFVDAGDTTKLNGLISDFDLVSYTGLVSSNDLTLAVSISEYDSYIANNKTYYELQESLRNYSQSTFDINQATTVQTAVSSSVGNVVSGVASLFNPATVASGVSSLTSVLTSGVNTAITYSASENLQDLSIEQSLLEQQYTIDNLKASPNNITNAQGNVLLQSSIFLSPTIDFGVYNWRFSHYLIKRAPIPIVATQANDINMRYGWEINQVAQLLDYLNVFSCYNYLQTNITTVKMTEQYPSNLMMLLRDCLNNGVRMWNNGTTIGVFTNNAENTTTGGITTYGVSINENTISKVTIKEQFADSSVSGTELEELTAGAVAESSTEPTEIAE